MLRLGAWMAVLAGACQWVSVPSGVLVQCEANGTCVTAGYVCQSDGLCHPPGTNGDAAVSADAGGFGVCNASNCPNGCCLGSACISTPTAAACGSGGKVCASCSSTADRCTAGECACGTKAPCSVSGQTCQGGSCACPVGQTLCSTGAACIPSGSCCVANDCPAPGPCQTAPVECRNGSCAYSNVLDATLCGDGGTECWSGQCVEFLYLPSNFNPGLVGTPSGAINLTCGTSTFDSGSGIFGNWCGQPQPVPQVVTLTNGQQVIVLAMAGLTVASGSTLHLTGPLPVILAVFDAATISGTVRGSSSSADGGWLGPGSGSLACQGSLGSPGAGVSDGGPIDNGAGGGGGGFGSSGGGGGNGGAASSNGGSAGTYAPNPPLPNLVPLQGGCPGGNGGTSDLGPGGTAGAGGGAVQISVARDLTVAVGGIITVSGAGAAGGVAHAGGGGGGSGGAILLEANRLGISGTLTANGGGGGGGGGSGADAGAGSPGDDGSETASTNANGGAGGGPSCAGNGGQGASGANGSQGGGSGCNNTGGGGGGGGGVGYIRLNYSSSCSTGGSTISPGASSNGGGC
jgi:hypothetical protein